jgi:hypothetical protein
MRDPPPEAPPDLAPPAARLAAPVIAGLVCLLAIELAPELAITLLGEDPERPSLLGAWLEIGAEHPLRIAMCGALAVIAWRSPPPGPTGVDRGTADRTG